MGAVGAIGCAQGGMCGPVRSESEYCLVFLKNEKNQNGQTQQARTPFFYLLPCLSALESSLGLAVWQSLHPLEHQREVVDFTEALRVLAASAKAG